MFIEHNICTFLEKHKENIKNTVYCIRFLSSTRINLNLIFTTLTRLIPSSSFESASDQGVLRTCFSPTRTATEISVFPISNGRNYPRGTGSFRHEKTLRRVSYRAIKWQRSRRWDHAFKNTYNAKFARAHPASRWARERERDVCFFVISRLLLFLRPPSIFNEARGEGAVLVNKRKAHVAIAATPAAASDSQNVTIG